MAKYGRKGGDGPNSGKRATMFYVTLPNGKIVQKRVFNPPKSPTGYAYQHEGTWYLAAVAEPGSEQFAHYTQCPAKAGS